MTGTEVVTKANLVPALTETAERAREYAKAAKAPNTMRAYSADLRHFTTWCESQGLEAMPAVPETVGLFLAHCAEFYRTSTVQRRLTAIAQAHRVHGHELDTRHPAVRDVLAGIKRKNGTAQLAKAPVLVADLKAMLAGLPDTLIGARDRALLLLGFAGAFRRSELVALDVDQVDQVRDGLVVIVRRSKTDQEGEGRKVAVPYTGNPDTCPVRAVLAWLEASGLEDGPLFHSIARNGTMGGRLSDKAVVLVVKRRAKAAGLDPARYAGHSLRAGFATSAAAGGASERAIMNQTGHKSLVVARRYIRDGNLFRDHALSSTGL